MHMLFLFGVAQADIPPPPDQHWIEAEVVITAPVEGHTLVLYPWGDSDGEPMAAVKEVQPGTPISFGRRIPGEPALFAVPTDTWRASSHSSSAPMAAQLDPVLVAFLEQNALRCNWTYTPPRLGSSSIPSHTQLRFTASVEGGECLVHAQAEPSTDPGAAPPPAERVCAAAPAAGSGALVLLSLLALQRRRVS